MWLPILMLITGATALCGSLLLQSDPWLEPFMSPLVLHLGQWLLSQPEWLRFPVKDGLLYLTPLTVCCCFGCASACAELFFAIPSHSTGLGGTIRPLVVLMCGCLHATIFACCWHCRSLIWRPHGSVAYTDLYEAAMDLGHSDPEDVKPSTAMARPSLEAQDPLGQPGGHPLARPAGPSDAAPPSVNVAPPQELQTGDVDLLLRLPSGRRVHCHFQASDLISQIYDAVEAEASSEPEIRNGSPYCLVTIHPKQAFQDKELTLAEAGLQNSTVLNVEIMR
eukprot:Skav206198  [mRNA]  locus=scaffold1844:334728:335564:- [translate_table: standard]